MYDYAKVYQSVCGYDFVLLDRTRCDAYVKSMREFADAELSQRLGAEGLRHLRVVTRHHHRSPSVLVLSDLKSAVMPTVRCTSRSSRCTTTP